MPRLTAAALPSLSAAVARPGYDRAAVVPGIVHVGVGGFHRSHQAVYYDDLLGAGGDPAWGVCGVGLLPGDASMRDVLAEQDNLYTLLVTHPDGFVDARVVGSLVEYLFAPDDPDAVVERMAAATTRIVSLTITEGGYNVSAVTGAFDPAHPGVQHDLQPGVPPRTAFGLVTEALRRRRELGLGPFTVVSCDNVPGNGDVARTSFTAFAALRDPDLGAWVGEHVPFPNSMVDRITPGTTDVHRTALRHRFGVTDGWPVVCEPFTQWVLEDRFAAGRPALEDVGVQLVDDVAPYELMKLRLLNASHQVLGYLGVLAGYTYVHDACQDPLFRRFLLGYLEREGAPTLPPVPGIDLARYEADLVGRFANPNVRDTLARLCAESSDRIPTFLLPVVRDNLAAGGEVRLSAAAVAGWARYAEGVDEDGTPIEVVDSRAAALRVRAAGQRADPLAFLRDRELFGDLVDDPRFTGPYTEALQALHTSGARVMLEQLLRPGTSDPGHGVPDA
ncbi:mannitol dehydrogenase family protein [Modestobacter sp. I12A-02628]|uniref:Mannitol-1-phosphate 5-dehydrogenase n=1 Tax=Goekera deserti TaxID=2497753 RepID=A0A7K3WIQ9_9ACTN|nr:mannitol dehydrogenase family protein [Goekera deserti]MPQ97058.1 mannitol dehydrogenase family protein [Goekera deserti]NDI46625.1 mannitol dehydrogenase family protein [Goekera deserti]NEL56381.1 mannitol dehydrogenase family protein [Goekera deserti]